MPIKSLTEEHYAKLKAGREKFWAKQRELKLLEPQIEEMNETISSLDSGKEKKLKVNSGPGNAREYIVKRINAKRDKLLDAKIDMAIGYHYTDADGNHVYEKKPDPASSEYLLNQLIGKPKESIEVKTINLNVDF